MLLGRSSIQKTHYDILSVKEDATHDEIRASYRAAVLDSHPDRLQARLETFGSPSQLEERFLKVQKAWEILGNSKSRAVYDMELKASILDFEVADDVSLEEMMVEDNGEVVELIYLCRCGDHFSIDSGELGEMGFTLAWEGRMELKAVDGSPASVVLPCGSCSLKIRLLLNSSS